MNKEKITLDQFYTSKEVTKASLLAILLTVILAVPVVLVIIQLYSLFLMRVYLINTIAFILMYSIVELGLFIRKWILKSIRKTEYNYNKEILMDSIVFLILFVLFYLFIMLIIIPKFVI